MKYTKFIVSAVVAAFLIVSCEMQQPTSPGNTGATDQSSLAKKSGVGEAAGDFIVEFTSGAAEFTATVEQLGGTVDFAHAATGLAAVSGIDDKTARKLGKANGVKQVTRDLMIQWVNPDLQVRQADAEELGIGDDESYFGYQWALQAISAPAAWEAGARGAGVRVAVIDGGISKDHIDLKDNIDNGSSHSFVPGFAYYEDDPGFRHATHVAGIIAAEDNGIGTIGVAPYATIIALKALQSGSGAFSWIINAILYAADEADADIINMSLGAVFPRNSLDAAKLNAALGHAMNYATQHGVTIVAAAGNNGADFDHAGPWVSMPAEAQHVIAVSATGPVGFAYGGTDFDRPASYTNYGQSLVDFAAPGGDDTLYPDSTDWYLDMVISPGAGTAGYYFADGTSMAAPHVAGVAALIIEHNGGSMAPAQVIAQLKQTSDDLGKPGNDDYYGQGRVNAYRAVTE